MTLTKSLIFYSPYFDVIYIAECPEWFAEITVAAHSNSKTNDWAYIGDI